MDAYSCLVDVDCYDMDVIHVGKTTISQVAFLCNASMP